MRISDNNIFNTSILVKLKNHDWLEKQRIAGKIAANTLTMLSGMLKRMAVGKTKATLTQLNNMAENFIISQGGIPTFKGYKGFPSGVCISVNKQLVHGIPTDYILQDGDVVSFDLGVTIDGAIADTAITCIYGQPKSFQHTKLIQATEDCLMKGIQAVEVGKRLGCIGYAISKCAKSHGFSIVTKYGGHGIDTAEDGTGIPHAPPFVANKSNLDEGIRIQSGLVIAIEPMLVIGSAETRTLDDGWTVATNDIGAHFEHSIYVHEDHVEIITDRTNL